jgi:hypothetical protein
MIMAEDNNEKPSYLSQLAHFYFAPELRTVATILYLGVFGYFCIYYLDNLFLALRFILYILMGHTALQGVEYLFTGMAFVVSLVFPFFISFYSIFVLHRIWHKPDWAVYVKWLMTLIIIVFGVLLIIISDEAARLSARQDVMRSFVEDAGIAGKI